MSITHRHPEFNNEWLFSFDKDTPLKNQVIFKFNNNLLLNVRKIYTNYIYYGVMYTTFNISGDIFHIFRCKDRGYPEKLVDDKDAFVNIFVNKLSSAPDRLLKRSKFKSIKVDFLQEYDVNFLFDSNNQYYATTAVLNNKAPIRGIYGATSEEEYQDNINQFGFSTLNRVPTEKEVKYYLIDKQMGALKANYITRVNTEYSQIKVYHKSEVN